MKCRQANLEDLEDILHIIGGARTKLIERGIPQWQNGDGPSTEIVRKDIERGECYVLEQDRVVGTAVLTAVLEEAYDRMTDGQWAEHADQYLSIHRVAIDPVWQGKGYAKYLIQSLLKKAEEKGYSDIRIDTHPKNLIMQRTVSAVGFVKRGQIMLGVSNGERIAYQYEKEEINLSDLATQQIEKKTIYMISFTKQGGDLNQQLNTLFQQNKIPCESYAVGSFSGTDAVRKLDGDLSSLIGRNWGKGTFLFIGAAGIAVRLCAPWIRDKFTDSAVLVMDEKGQYVIPLLSGHMGGAVEIAGVIASLCKAVPVITTATDIQHKFAVDVFAKSHGLKIGSRELAKKISASILAEELIGFYSELPIPEKLPKQLCHCSSQQELRAFSYGIAITKEREPLDSDRILYLYPAQEADLVVGIGCRKGTEQERIMNALQKIFKRNGKSIDQIEAIVSIDLKKEERGLIQLAEKLHCPFITYSSDQLKLISEVSSHSDFVEQTTGLDNVCERAALFHGNGGRLIQPKTIVDGMTFSLVERSEGNRRVLVFAGTTESRQVIEGLKELPVKVYASVATEYGTERFEQISGIELISGRKDAEEIAGFLREKRMDLVIDATHPFAVIATEQIKRACEMSDTPYLRCLRESASFGTMESSDTAQDNIHYVASVAEAVEYLEDTKGNILVTTGSKELKHYTELTDYQERCYVRVLPARESLETCLKLGYSGSHIIAMQGPFSKETNVALLHQSKAAYFVTKESGPSGGYSEKREAAEAAGAVLVVIRRPSEEGFSVKETVEYCRNV